MKPSLRLLRVLLGSHLRGRVDPNSEVVTRWRVMPGDLDLFGHMNNSSYLAVMDLARIDFLVRIGLFSHVVRNRWIVPVGSATVDFKGALKLFEPYEIATKVVFHDERWFYIRQEFRRVPDTGRPIGVGYVKAMFRDRQHTIPPSDIMERYLGTKPHLPLTDDVSLRFGLSALPPPKPVEHEPIAIVGIGCRLPGGIDNAHDLWRVSLDRRECIVDIPESRWAAGKFHDPTGNCAGRSYVQRAGLLSQDYRCFDASFFGMTPREAGVVDPQQRLLLETSWEALEDAGIPAQSLAGSRTGVWVGGFMTDMLVLIESPENRERIESQSGTAATHTMLSNRLSYFYDLRGPSMSLDTACSSSLVALHEACQSIWSGESELALVGGVNSLLLPEAQITMAKGRFLSPRGRCGSFSDTADGYVRSEGAAVVVLKRLSAAQRDGNQIHAVVLGSAVNQDGRTSGITVPNGDAQVAVMREAYARAGVDPSAVAYVEAHGTGTPVGDPIEAKAIGTVLGQGRAPDRPCYMGSAKANLGHLEAAAGVAGVIKAVLTLKHRTVAPHPHLERVNPHIALDELCLDIPVQPTPLPQQRLIAGVNSFGYGGTNAHVVIGEAPPVASGGEGPSDRPYLLVLSANSKQAIAALATRYAERLANGENARGLCRSAAVHRSHLRYRVAVRAADGTELAERLAALAAEKDDVPGIHKPSLAQEPQKLLFVYTGMGPQWWGMGQQLMAREPVFAAAVEECDQIFRRLSGISIAAEMARDEATSQMARTSIAQPANLVLQVALTKLLGTFGITADGVLGHSIGEVGSAWAAGALSLEDALRVAYHRSRLQQQLAGRGGMLAVGIDADEAQRRLAKHPPGVSVAAVNSTTSVTLAGDQRVLDAIAAELAKEGIFRRALAVEVPYHSPIMETIEGDLKDALKVLNPMRPSRPWYSTVKGGFGDAAELNAQYWWQNARQAVLFADAMKAALGDGYTTVVEVGPHPVLASSIRDCMSHAKVSGTSVASLVRKQEEPTAIADAIAALHVLGHRVDWRAWMGGVGYSGAPSYPWQREVHWSESDASARRRRAESNHPLVISTGSPATALVTAEAVLGVHRYLADHRVADSVLFPAAAFIELALAARQHQHQDWRCSIEQLELLKAVTLHDTAAARLRLSMAEAPLFAIHHDVAGEEPTLCVRGKLYSIGASRPAIELSALVRGFDDTVAKDALYTSLEERGLCYGPAFRAVERLWRKRGETLAEIVLPEGLDAAGYHFHPVMLDAAFHSLIAASSIDRDCDILPIAIEQLQVFATATRRLFAHGVLEEMGKGRLRGHIALYGDNGELLADVRGFTCTLLPRRNEAREERLQARTYGRAWEVQTAGQPAEELRWIALGPCQQDEADAAGLQRASGDEDLARCLSTPNGTPAVLDLRFSQARPEGEDPVSVGLDDADTLLATVRALPFGVVQRYVVVTRGAQALTSNESPALERAALIGLCRTIMSERPDLRLTLVDFDALPLCLTDLVALVGRTGQEQEVAYRGERLHVARITRTSLLSRPTVVRSETPKAPLPDQGYELVVEQEGQLDSIGFSAFSRRGPGIGEVEVEVEAVPLGFKDVMKALGLLSERARAGTYVGDTIGMEGSGRVSAIGPGVSGLSIGDRVYGVAPAFLRSHVIVPAHYVAKLPDDMSFEDGSNLTTYLTAYYSFVRLARLRAGETVLIHGAAGGVGLAAIEVARYCGAEIFATVSTPEKRAYLERLGVKYVSNSRDLSFADDVRAWTQGRGVDVVLNFSPGEIVDKGIACLAPGGRFIEIGKISFDKDAPLRLRPFNENLTYAALDFDRLTATKPAEIAPLYREVMALIAEGHLRPTVSRSWPASQVADAFRTFARGKHIGKLIIKMRDPDLLLRPRARRERLSPDATYLITGGLGGFGLEVAQWMAAQGARHLALCSRRGVTSSEATSRLEQLRAAGVEVRAIAVDVADFAALQSALADIRATMPPLAGIVHSAAVLDDRPVAEIDRASLLRVLAPKARGAWNLHLLTREQPLDFFVLFSSIASMIGNARQGNYVAANTFLDQLAHHRRKHGLVATAIHWGALGESGMVSRDAAVARHLAHSGLAGLSNSEALHALGRVLDGSTSEIAVADVDWPRFAEGRDQWTGKSALSRLLIASERRTESIDPISRTFGHLAEQERQQLIETTLLSVVTRVMGLKAGDIDVNQPLRERGMDSIMALEMVTGIERELGVKVSALDLAGGPSLRALSQTLMTLVRRSVSTVEEAAA